MLPNLKHSTAQLISSVGVKDCSMVISRTAVTLASKKPSVTDAIIYGLTEYEVEMTCEWIKKEVKGAVRRVDKYFGKEISKLANVSFPIKRCFWWTFQV